MSSEKSVLIELERMHAGEQCSLNPEVQAEKQQ